MKQKAHDYVFIREKLLENLLQDPLEIRKINSSGLIPFWT